MGVSAQKNRLLHGMPTQKAKKLFVEIWDKENPGIPFEKKMWKWLNIYHGIRSHNQTFDIICQAFAEKVANLHSQKRILEQRIVAQRVELKKRLAEIEQLKTPARPASEEKPE